MREDFKGGHDEGPHTKQFKYHLEECVCTPAAAHTSMTSYMYEHEDYIQV